MNIRILQLLEGARQASGLVVVIDVFRAFSVACYVFGNGAARIIPVGELEAAYELKRRHPHYLLLGERGGQRPPGFDFGNSPTEVEHYDFTDRTVVQTTSAGTQGLVNVPQATETITGSFVNAYAVVNYIKAKDPAEVSLVCMGREAVEPSDEDTLCARFIKDSLEGRATNFAHVRKHLRRYASARKFFDPLLTWAPESDFDLCLDLGRFDFVLRAEPDEDQLRILKKG
ncbi:MAG: 2-phosphosulfolactate phosphatase [Pyrinomonadaceae bacterium]